MKRCPAPLPDLDTKYNRSPKQRQPFGYSVEVCQFIKGWQWAGKRRFYWYRTAKARDQAADAMRKNRFYSQAGDATQLQFYRGLRLEQRD